MATIKWLGEDELHETEDGSGAGPSYTTAFGLRDKDGKPLRFPRGEAVEVADLRSLRKASTNQFFEVEGFEDKKRGRPAKASDDQDAG